MEIYGLTRLHTSHTDYNADGQAADLFDQYEQETTKNYDDARTWVFGKPQLWRLRIILHNRNRG